MLYHSKIGNPFNAHFIIIPNTSTTPLAGRFKPILIRLCLLVDILILDKRTYYSTKSSSPRLLRPWSPASPQRLHSFVPMQLVFYDLPISLPPSSLVASFKLLM